MNFGSKFALGAILLSGAIFAGCQQQDVNAPGKDSNTNNTAISRRCAADSVPVCGKDGVSYRNACAAGDVGETEVASQGTCPGQPLDGWTSANFKAPVKEDPLGDPIVKPIKDSGWCGTPDPIGPDPIGVIPGDDVPGVDPVPADPLNGKCGDPFPDIAIKCASDLAPACGCDGKTYRNGCYAMGLGHVWVKSEGACPGQPYVEE